MIGGLFGICDDLRRRSAETRSSLRFLINLSLNLLLFYIEADRRQYDQLKTEVKRLEKLLEVSNIP